MRGIAQLLFGNTVLGNTEGKLLDLLGRGDDERPGWDEGSGLADRVRRSGEWCGTTPGQGSAGRAVRGLGRR
jgi:hypothetical protein